ncbi:MAG TPA: hypothetical protein VMU07_01080 [Candidatus Paceibacterota bacterium]|nr:hypothetical protein [Candidatus Paceibacterota bacterium]
MAIVIEEEKSRSNIVRIIGWLVILGVVGAAIYYIFFAQPQLAIIAPAGNLNAVAPIVESNIDPNQVLGSDAFKALKAAPVPPVPTSTGNSPSGRPNPFIAP